MNKTILAALAAASGLMFAGLPAHAQMGDQAAMMAQFQAADVNKDGKYSKQEWFNMRDTNKDGSITAAELGQMATFVMSLDANKDGKLTLAEYTGPELRFTKSDANKDGFLDQGELMAMFSAMRPPS